MSGKRDRNLRDLRALRLSDGKGFSVSDWAADEIDALTAMVRDLRDSNFNLALLVKGLARPDDTTAAAALLAANKADTRARALIGEDGKHG